MYRNGVVILDRGRKRLGDDEMIKSLMDMYTKQSKGWAYDDDIIVSADEDNFWESEDIEEEVDAEFATILMDELTANNLDSHILLKYPAIADWWGSVLKERKKKEDALRKREEAKRKREEDKHARDALLARLTPEERRLLGVK